MPGRMRSRRPAGPSSKSSAVIMSALRSGASAHTASAARQSETSKSQAGKSSRYFRQSVNLARRPAKQQVQQKKTLPYVVAVALGRLYGAERPTVDREEMRHAVTAEIHRKTTVSMKTLDRAIKLIWPSA